MRFFEFFIAVSSLLSLPAGADALNDLRASNVKSIFSTFKCRLGKFEIDLSTKGSSAKVFDDTISIGSEAVTGLADKYTYSIRVGCHTTAGKGGDTPCDFNDPKQYIELSLSVWEPPLLGRILSPIYGVDLSVTPDSFNKLSVWIGRDFPGTFDAYRTQFECGDVKAFWPEELPK